MKHLDPAVYIHFDKHRHTCILAYFGVIRVNGKRNHSRQNSVNKVIRDSIILTESLYRG
jgi:hypothetical protein